MNSSTPRSLTKQSERIDLMIEDEDSLETLLQELESLDQISATQSETLTALLGAGAGSPLSVGLLSSLGTAGVSAAGISSNTGETP